MMNFSYQLSWNFLWLVFQPLHLLENDLMISWKKLIHYPRSLQIRLPHWRSALHPFLWMSVLTQLPDWKLLVNSFKLSNILWKLSFSSFYCSSLNTFKISLGWVCKLTSSKIWTNIPFSLIKNVLRDGKKKYLFTL